MLDEFGREVPDPRPVEWPANLKRPLSLQEEIQRFVRVEMSQRAAEHGFETFEESDDFDVPDEDEWNSPYQLTELQEEVMSAPPAPRSPSGSKDEPPPPAKPQSGSGDVAPSATASTVTPKVEVPPAGGPT